MFRRNAPAPQPADQADEVSVPGVMEATTHATFDLNGEPVFLNGPDGGRLGDIVLADHPAARLHPELFRPLKLSLGLRYDMLRAHPAAHVGAEPQLASRSIADTL